MTQARSSFTVMSHAQSYYDHMQLISTVKRFITVLISYLSIAENRDGWLSCLGFTKDYFDCQKIKFSCSAIRRNRDNKQISLVPDYIVRRDAH